MFLHTITDNIVLIKPFWHAFQVIIDILVNIAALIDMSCTAVKTCCLVFDPVDRSKVMACQFPSFLLNDTPLKFVKCF